MQIGIPRSLLYYYYFPFWNNFFSHLGYQVVLSDKVSEELLNRGVKHSISEICVPMKVYIGQVLNLLDKGVDLIYIPRFISIKKGIFFCPKFLGLTDMVVNSLTGVKDKILTHHIKTNSDDISDYSNYRKLQTKLGVSKKELKQALKNGQEAWQQFRALHKKGYTSDQILEDRDLSQQDGDLTIGVLAYVYNIYDKYINMNLLEKLREMNVKIITFEMLEEKEIEKELSKFSKPVFWEFSNMLLGAGYHFFNSPEIDGIIHVTAFGCGPDSIIGPFLEIDAEKHNKPFMTLRIDEQTGESHLLTRIEAFVDLLRLQKTKAARKLV